MENWVKFPDLSRLLGIVWISALLPPATFYCLSIDVGVVRRDDGMRRRLLRRKSVRSKNRDTIVRKFVRHDR